VSAVHDDEIRLALPAAPEYARIARLTVAGVATRLGFSYDEVEDLRIAVGEACSVLIADPPSGRLNVVYRLGDDALEVHATTEGAMKAAPPAPLPTADLTEQILGAVVDDHGIDVVARSVWLRKHRTDH
jgi:anti-sigma regulatory factor (Ser/Thr protein kinase)